MSDRNVLPFQVPDEHDAELTRRLVALYERTPAANEQQIARCVRGVRESAEIVGAARGREFGEGNALSAHVSAPYRPAARWMVGIAAAAILVVATLRPRSNSSAPSTDGTSDSVLASRATVASNGSVTSLGSDAVRFDIHLPDSAKAVAIVGDFNGWNQSATPMAQRSKGGTWSANVALLPGRHVYAFVVDGKKWVVDPMAPQVPDDGYGPSNAVVIDPSSK